MVNELKDKYLGEDANRAFGYDLACSIFSLHILPNGIPTS